MTHQAPLVVIAVNRIKSLADVDRVQQVSQAHDCSHVLANQLIHKAPIANLKIRMHRVLGSYSDSQTTGNLIRWYAANLLYVVFSVKKICIDPTASLLEHPLATAGQIAVAHGFCHALCSTQSGQIPYATHRIWAV